MQYMCWSQLGSVVGLARFDYFTIDDDLSMSNTYYAEYILCEITTITSVGI